MYGSTFPLEMIVSLDDSFIYYTRNPDSNHTAFHPV